MKESARYVKIAETNGDSYGFGGGSSLKARGGTGAPESERAEPKVFRRHVGAESTRYRDHSRLVRMPESASRPSVTPSAARSRAWDPSSCLTLCRVHAGNSRKPENVHRIATTGRSGGRKGCEIPMTRR